MKTIKDNLLAYYDLTADANDKHGSFNLTNNGAIAFSDDGAYFPGVSTSNLLIPQALPIACYGATCWSFFGWFKHAVDCPTHSRTVGISIGGTRARMSYEAISGKPRCGTRSKEDDSEQLITSPDAITVTNAYFVCFNVYYTDKKLELYVNGVLVNTRTDVPFGSDTFSSQSDVGNYFGRFPQWHSTNFFKGHINRAGFKRCALSQSEVAFLYNGGLGRAYSELVVGSLTAAVTYSRTPEFEYSEELYLYAGDGDFIMTDATEGAHTNVWEVTPSGEDTVTYHNIPSISIPGVVGSTLVKLTVNSDGFVPSVWEKTVIIS